ncbi:hypothetical protein PACTADRAFT_50158 [Pachysolen tannophilus NRRL Y-2460]|uniref:Protein kinase domain-containing protein n=1 Tax=Pachysolen tannophilus NRRL Y-2460 TaxID=669874 RepID=A0A1E4TUV5_PACTA|nr:hypothetical protein PACTADRAFT_50158 [Pachysolen tannophilus NRRL Y-2460]
MAIFDNLKNLFGRNSKSSTTKTNLSANTNSTISSVSTVSTAQTTSTVNTSNNDNFKKIIKDEDIISKKLNSVSDSLYPELLPRYVLEKKVGEGAFSEVYKAFDNIKKQNVAIKIIDKTNMTIQQINAILKEIAIMSKLKHPNIVQLYNYKNSTDSKYCFLFMEFVEGGEIFNQIIKYTYFSEDLSRHVIVQVANALRYLHEEIGVVHRDIKPENLLFVPIPFKPRTKEEQLKARRQSDDDTKIDEGIFIEGVGGATIGTIKVADFGLSKVLWNSNTRTPVGTQGYTAPEILRDESYSKSVDCFSLGCVLYTLLCGFPPFYDTDPKVLAEKVSKSEYCFLSPWWSEISKEANDLVSNLLTADANKRFTIDELLQHPWVLKNENFTKPALDAPTLKERTNLNDKEKSSLYQASNDTSDSLLTPRAEAIRLVFETAASQQKLPFLKTRIQEELEEDDEYEDLSMDSSSEESDSVLHSSSDEDEAIDNESTRLDKASSPVSRRKSGPFKVSKRKSASNLLSSVAITRKSSGSLVAMMDENYKDNVPSDCTFASNHNNNNNSDQTGNRRRASSIAFSINEEQHQKLQQHHQQHHIHMNRESPATVCNKSLGVLSQQSEEFPKTPIPEEFGLKRNRNMRGSKNNSYNVDNNNDNDDNYDDDDDDDDDDLSLSSFSSLAGLEGDGNDGNYYEDDNHINDNDNDKRDERSDGGDKNTVAEPLTKMNNNTYNNENLPQSALRNQQFSKVKSVLLSEEYPVLSRKKNKNNNGVSISAILDRQRSAAVGINYELNNSTSAFDLKPLSCSKMLSRRKMLGSHACGPSCDTENINNNNNSNNNNNRFSEQIGVCASTSIIENKIINEDSPIASPIC